MLLTVGAVLGNKDGELLGSIDGTELGFEDGDELGAAVGAEDGAVVGDADGEELGALEGDTDGVELKFGNAEALTIMAEKTGKQEGFGKILGMGSRRMCDPPCVPPCPDCRIGPKMRPLSHFRHVTFKNPSVCLTFKISFSNVSAISLTVFAPNLKL